MRANILTAVLLILPLVSTAAEPAKSQLQFQGQTFELAFAQANETAAINEYIPQGETLDRWKAMLAVRTFAGRRDYEPMAGNLVKALKQQNPLARAAIHTSADGRRTMVDFVTWDVQQGITEFNVFLYQLGPDGNSVIAQQYAERAYGKEQGLEFLHQLKDRRMKLLAAVGEFKFPAVAAQ